MKKLSFIPIFIYLFVTITILQSCDDENVNKGNTTKTPAQTKEWINTRLRNDYLWNDEVKEKSPDYDLGIEDFFESLLSLKDGKDRASGRHQYYSTIKYKGSDTRAINSESTYGFEFVLYSIPNEDYYYARILYVLPDSPAQKAGLKRGDYITHINDIRVTANTYSQLYNGGQVKFTLGYIESPREITVEASYQMDENPLFLDTIYQIEGKKIGYLIYNQFATGPNDDYNDKTYDDEMKYIFNYRFSKENLDEFVLDLRYNGGGYLSCAQLLAGLIVSETHKNSIFCISRDNKKLDYKYYFTNGGSHLNISRLFVLTTASTASASEAVINGLKPYMEVIIIGEKTEGKNVGSEKIEDKGYEWTMNPIMVQIYNKDMESDYENGFIPDYEVDELANQRTIYELGDIRESLLSSALSQIKEDKKSYIRQQKEITNSFSPIIHSITRKQSNAVLMDR